MQLLFRTAAISESSRTRDWKRSTRGTTDDSRRKFVSRQRYERNVFLSNATT